MAKRRFTYGVYPQGTLEVADGAHRAATQDLINVFGYGVPLPDDKKKRRKSSVRGVICKPCITESERGEPKVHGGRHNRTGGGGCALTKAGAQNPSSSWSTKKSPQMPELRGEALKVMRAASKASSPGAGWLLQVASHSCCLQLRRFRRLPLRYQIKPPQYFPLL